MKSYLGDTEKQRRQKQIELFMHLAIGASVHPSIGRHSGHQPCTGWRQIAQLFFFLGFLLFAISSSVLAQSNTVKVRLYSLHSEKRLKISARIGDLVWKNCQQCVQHHTAALVVEATGQGLTLDGQVAEADAIFVEGDYHIEPGEGLAFALTFPLEIKAERGSLKAFLTLPLEDYVTAALAGESGTFQQDESLKAMAVAVRSYATRFRGRHASEGFDFCDSTHCQTLNFKGITSRIRDAVAATRGEMLWYQGSPAATFYHQNCGGTLAAVQESWPDLAAPYLKQQTDPSCVRGAPLPWKAQIGRKQLEDALKFQGLAIPPEWGRLEIVSRTASGRVSKLAFRPERVNAPGTSGAAGTAARSQLISASTLRFAIGRTLGWNQVRSDLYEVETTGDYVIFTGRGAGHGVGLCQAGAEEMAREGQNYRQILAFYYPGAALGVNAQGLHWQKTQGNRFEMLSTQPDQDAEVLRVADSTLPTVESELGWKLNFTPQLKVYPTLDAYRDSTGQPGWIAAFSRGHSISLQPLVVLKSKSILESTLQHEFIHLLVEARAHAGTPLWFREGLVLYFAGSKQVFEPGQMSTAEIEKALSRTNDRKGLERAYAAARTKVGQMIEQNGKVTVLVWLTNGLPEESGDRRDRVIR